MAEKIVSPGVFTNEIDQSFLPATAGPIGAAIVGPTIKGPILKPTIFNIPCCSREFETRWSFNRG